MLYETEGNNLTVLSQHPLHLRCNFLRNCRGSIKGIFVTFLYIYLYKAIRIRDTVVGTLTDLQAERLRYRGTIPDGRNWLASHSFCVFLLFSVSVCTLIHSSLVFFEICH